MRKAAAMLALLGSVTLAQPALADADGKLQVKVLGTAVRPDGIEYEVAEVHGLACHIALSDLELHVGDCREYDFADRDREGSRR